MIKVMGVGEGGGGGRSTKKYKIQEKIEVKKNSCMQSRPEKKDGLPHILHNVSQEGMQESILCAKNQLFE